MKTVPREAKDEKHDFWSAFCYEYFFFLSCMVVVFVLYLFFSGEGFVYFWDETGEWEMV